jgi:MerR family transcriptional activator of bmr gene
MDKKLFSIGEVSKIKGITKKALRFYERIGLLKPYYVSPYNKYRYYSIDQFVSIDIIKALRVMDISPLDIKAVFKNKDTREAMQFLDLQKEKAAQKIEELRQVIGNIEGVQHLISHSLSSISHPGVYRRQIEQRDIVSLPFHNFGSIEDAMIEFAKFDRIITEHHLLNTYETGILFQSVGREFVPSSIFNTVAVTENSDSSITSTLPAGEYLCVCCNRENASKQSLKISRYCARHKLQPRLILQVELLNDVFSVDSSYFELQMLVQNTCSIETTVGMPLHEQGDIK